MESEATANKRPARMKLAIMPTPFKVLATCILATLAFGMVGALGQVILHDIIPKFYSGAESTENNPDAEMGKMPQHASGGERGDLFAGLSTVKAEAAKPFYKDEQFVWTLRWTHIHLFGINMVFIFLGLITALLDAGSKLRTWLIVLPFIGVLIDISAMWLKGFVFPAFFWLHIPGGGIFAGIFVYVCLRALWEMWLIPVHRLNSTTPGFSGGNNECH